MATVGLIANPHAGKDVRRLVSAAGHTSDGALVGTLRRAIAGISEVGVTRILASRDARQLVSRAASEIGVTVEVLDIPVTGTRRDTVEAARVMSVEGCGCVLALGGDGTCRDVATGWSDAPLVAVSTGTNNLFPQPVEATSAGVAAGLVATATVALGEVAVSAHRVRVIGRSHGAVADEIALVEAALVEGVFTGSRAVDRASSVRWVVAVIAEPASTGLSAIAGRIEPRGRDERGGVLVRLGEEGRALRVPIVPGRFDQVGVVEVVALAPGDSIDLPGGGVLALDGERTVPLDAGTPVTVSVDLAGPRVVDVAATLRLAAAAGVFLHARESSEVPVGH